MTRFKAIDVSGYQPAAQATSWWQNAQQNGIQGGIVKLSEGTSYRNPYGEAQISAIKAAGLKVSGYHFARFVGNASVAQQEANYAVGTAHAMNLPNGSPLVLDYELRQGWQSSNTQACIAFCQVIKQSGYVPVFYSYSGMSQLWNYEAVYQATGAHFWLAAYPHMGAVSDPDYNYFPSISTHTDAWQYTDNLFGWGVDGSVDFTGVFTMAEKVTSGGHFDGLEFNGKEFTVTGWFGGQQAQGKPYAYIIVINEKTGQEYCRTKVDLASRPDVHKVYPDIPGGDKSGFVGTLPYTTAMANQACKIIFRYSDDAAGNGNYYDYDIAYAFDKAASWIDNTAIHNGQLIVSGWYATDRSISKDYAFMILYDAQNKRELQRVPVTLTDRADVGAANKDIFDSTHSGFSAGFKYSADLCGRQLQIIMRYSDAENGEGHYVDYWFKPFKAPDIPVLDGKIEQQFKAKYVKVESQADGTSLITVK